MGTIINKFGKMTGWNSLTVNMMGRDVEGITAVKYDDTLTKENVYGAGKYPVGRGEGKYEAKATLTILKEEMDALQSALVPGKRIQDIAPFDVIAQYEMVDGKIVTDRIRNCEFMGRGVEVKQGDGSIAMAYELIVSHIDWNTI
ncbi:MAG: hypothetical protein IE931_03350 [Sphingobacteriales bacterium]|nr:hypothetical protein [Sphingobacteriales bacterium]